MCWPPLADSMRTTVRKYQNQASDVPRETSTKQQAHVHERRLAPLFNVYPLSNDVIDVLSRVLLYLGNNMRM
jgi:hypothetical protein